MLDMEVFIDEVVAFLDLDPKSVIQTTVEALPERQENEIFWTTIGFKVLQHFPL
jgi:hypothetical protein